MYFLSWCGRNFTPSLCRKPFMWSAGRRSVVFGIFRYCTCIAFVMRFWNILYYLWSFVYTYVLDYVYCKCTFLNDLNYWNKKKPKPDCDFFSLFGSVLDSNFRIDSYYAFKLFKPFSFKFVACFWGWSY